MVYSMTGYGKAEGNYKDRHIIVEVKSLNSKQMDLQMRTPLCYRSSEILFRNIINERVVRGKVDLTIQVEYRHNSSESATLINEELLLSYKSNIERFCATNNLPEPDNMLELLLRMPDVFKVENDAPSDEEVDFVISLLNTALDSLTKFREQEGASLNKVFNNKLDNILVYLSQVELYENARIERIYKRLEEGLIQLSENTKIDIDRSRLEQEMIFYIEKLDINEEKARLRNHVNYFRDTMSNESNIGKKLGFIAQEMGREINTLGSKSNQSEMQILVVKMKDELEQIKEQVLNVL